MLTVKGSHALTVVRPEDPDKITGEALQKAAFMSCGKDDSCGEAVTGFVSGLDPLDEDPALGGTGGFLAFTWREDKKSVPASAVKLALAEAVKKEKERGGGIISRARRKELKEQIQLMMLGKAPWTSSTVDLCFNQTTGELYVFEASEKKLDTILGRISEACDTDFKRGWAVESLAGLYSELLDGSREADDGWTVCEDGACSLAREDDEEPGRLSASNAPEAVKAAMEAGFAPVDLNLRVENADGETLCTFAPALEAGGRGWTLKKLKVKLAPSTDEDSDELEVACETYASICGIVAPLFAGDAD